MVLSTDAREQVNRILAGRPPQPGKASLNEAIDFINANPLLRRQVEGAAPTGLGGDIRKLGPLAQQLRQQLDFARAITPTATESQLLRSLPADLRQIPSSQILQLRRGQIQTGIPRDIDPRFIGEVRLAPRRTPLQIIKEAPRRGIETITGRTPQEIFSQLVGKEGDPRRPLTLRQIGAETVKLPLRVVSEGIAPVAGEGIEQAQERILPSGIVVKRKGRPSRIETLTEPAFGTITEETLTGLRQREVTIPAVGPRETKIFEPGRVKEGVEIGTTLGILGILPTFLISPGLVVEGTEIALDTSLSKGQRLIGVAEAELGLLIGGLKIKSLVKDLKPLTINSLSEATIGIPKVGIRSKGGKVGRSGKKTQQVTKKKQEVTNKQATSKFKTLSRSEQVKIIEDGFKLKNSPITPENIQKAKRFLKESGLQDFQIQDRLAEFLRRNALKDLELQTRQGLISQQEFVAQFEKLETGRQRLIDLLKLKTARPIAVKSPQQTFPEKLSRGRLRNDRRIERAKQKNEQRIEQSNKPLGQKILDSSSPAIIGEGGRLTSRFSGLGQFERTVETRVRTLTSQIQAPQIDSFVKRSLEIQRGDLLRILDSKVTLSITQLSKQLDLSKTKQNSLTRQLSATSLASNQNSLNRQINNLRTNQQTINNQLNILRNKQDQIRKNKQAFKFIPRLRLGTGQGFGGRTRDPFKPRTPRRPTKPKRPFKRKPPFFFKTKKKKKESKKKISITPKNFQVFVRKKGQDVKVGATKTLPKARKLIRKEIRGSLRASGFIFDKKKGIKVKPKIKNTKEFRLGKRDPLRLVERRGFRLDSRSETQAIQKAKRQAKPFKPIRSKMSKKLNSRRKKK